MILIDHAVVGNEHESFTRNRPKTHLHRTANLGGDLGDTIPRHPLQLCVASAERQGLAEGSLKPPVARTFPRDQIAEARRYAESNQQIGKIVETVFWRATPSRRAISLMWSGDAYATIRWRWEVAGGRGTEVTDRDRCSRGTRLTHARSPAQRVSSKEKEKERTGSARSGFWTPP
jgi:hypothetical protein